MAKLIWDLVDARTYEGGIDRGVLYRSAVPGVAWNGLVSVEESQPDKKVQAFYFDGVKYLETVDTSDFVAVLKAYSFPSGFAACLGDKPARPGVYLTRQPREQFGFSYRTGVDTSEYKIHLVYNATASPTERASNTLGASVNPDIQAWQITAVPKIVDGKTFRPTAHWILDSRIIEHGVLGEIEKILYGTVSSNPRLPEYSEIANLATLVVLVPDTVLGIAALVSGVGDLIATTTDGIYQKYIGSHLVETGTSGIYRLE